MQWTNLQCTFNTIAFDAGGADVFPHRATFGHDSNPLQVGLDLPFGLHVGMADIKATGRALTAYITISAHVLTPFGSAVRHKKYKQILSQGLSFDKGKALVPGKTLR